MQKFRIRKKTKDLANNKTIWWFVVHGDEKELCVLDGEWDKVHLQTSWRLEKCFAPLTTLTQDATNSNNCQSNQGSDPNPPPPPLQIHNPMLQKLLHPPPYQESLAKMPALEQHLLQTKEVSQQHSYLHQQIPASHPLTIQTTAMLVLQMKHHIHDYPPLVTPLSPPSCT